MKKIKLTDEVRQEEPAAWLVFTHDQDVYEYQVFGTREDASVFAWQQTQESGEADWPMYPLWASSPEYA